MNKIFRFSAGALFAILHSLLSAPAQAATEIRDTEIEQAMSDWAAPIAEAAKFGPVKIRILADNAMNAHVSGGSDVFVNTGLIERIESPAELQAVLAHEIGHSALGHMAQLGAKMRAETARSIAAQALGIGLLFINPMAATGVIAGAGGLAAQSLLAFTRDEERAADDYAARLLAKAGAEPAALLSVFKKMQSAREDKINPNNINHPPTGERIRNIRLQIDDNMKSIKPDADDARLKLIQAKLAGYLDSAGRVATLYPDANKSDPALYARAIARMRAGNLDSARTGTKTLIARHAGNPYFYELLGDIEFQRGDYDASIAAYENSLKGQEGKGQIEIALALVLAERKAPGDSARAAELARRTILSEPMPLGWLALARADPGKSDYYLAEYNLLTGAHDKAKSHARAAVRNLPPDSPEAVKAKDILSNEK